MRRYVPSAVAVLAVATVGLGITSCGLMSSGGDSSSGSGSGQTDKANVAAKVGGAGATPGAPNEVTRVAALLQVGIQQAKQGKWSAATTTFQDVLAINPKNVYALYDLGVIAQTNSDDASALQYYNEAIAANGKYTPALYNKAILLESNQPNQAISLYNKIISINPQASTAYLRLAFVNSELGNTARAQAADQKAIAIDPSLGKFQLPGRK